MSNPTTATSLRKIVRIEAKPGLADAARAALLELEQATRHEPGCREFLFYQALGSDTSFLLIEDFDDAAALDIHMKLPHTQKFFAQDLVASIKPIERTWML